MAKILVLGAGISGHTAVQYLAKKLGKKHEVVMISPNDHYNWFPSNIWVGVGKMSVKQVLFPLQKVYKKIRVNYKRAKATSIHPNGGENSERPYVTIKYVESGKEEIVDYDYLVNATGPKLNFEKVEGLGPKGHTVSVCTSSHASHAWGELQKVMAKLKNGEKQTIVIGTGHPAATCQGAAFEYILNVAFELKRKKLLDKADLVWLSNEQKIGDFGTDGITVNFKGKIMSSEILAKSLLKAYGVEKIITPVIVKRIEEGKIHYENMENEPFVQEFDFAMLIPPFTGHGIKAFDKNGEDITNQLFKPNGLMTVDADYQAKPYEEWSVEDWPSTYQNPTWDNIFAPGIAFAPPHTMSKPAKAKDGTSVTPAPPRTGMPSGVSGKVVAYNIIDRILNNDKVNHHKANMGKQGAACIISAGKNLWNGEGVSLTIYPIVPDYKKYPKYGRDMKLSKGDTGVSGHWTKLVLHYSFIYKAKNLPFWWIIPE